MFLLCAHHIIPLFIICQGNYYKLLERNGNNNEDLRIPYNGMEDSAKTKG